MLNNLRYFPFSGVISFIRGRLKKLSLIGTFCENLSLLRGAILMILQNNFNRLSASTSSVFAF